MNNKFEDDNYSEPFSHPRWKDVPWGETIGYRDIPEEERKKYKKILREHLKDIGVLKED